MKPIQLNEDVVIGDPSKDITETLQFKNNKPGNYYVFHKTYYGGKKVGRLMGQLMVIHEHHLNDVLQWVKKGTTVNIKSGIAGIFTKDTYREDDIFTSNPTTKLDLSVDVLPKGNKWYGHMVDRALSENKHGTYFKGCVCNTPDTNKTYEVHIARFRRRPVGIMIDFGLDNTRYAKYDWWLENKPVTAL